MRSKNLGSKYLGPGLGLAMVLALAACDDDQQQAEVERDAAPEVVQQETVTDQPATAMTEEQPAVEEPATAMTDEEPAVEEPATGLTDEQPAVDEPATATTEEPAMSETEMLLGRWESGDPVASVEYREDGTMTYEVEGQASEGRWEEDGTTLTLIIDGDNGESRTVACEFEVQGDELRFTEGDPQCDEMIFNRAS